MTFKNNVLVDFIHIKVPTRYTVPNTPITRTMVYRYMYNAYRGAICGLGIP